ncbi:MAG TPA: glycosyltransferase family 2 protein [Candidatus Lumbricidophila sp.]|nr:glycosyltransferase family 2 protein [Candidatus Lumbricidophila sp.]
MTLDIVMPFYGDPGLLRVAVESILRQTNPDWRLVVIDDAYPDPNPGDWLKSLGDPRVTYLRNDINLGVSGNFRKSLDVVEAPVFTLMGCDDELLPNYVERMLRAFADNPGAAYVQPGVVVVDGHGREVLPLGDRVKARLRKHVERTDALSGEPLATSLLKGNWTYFPSIAWRTEVVRRFGFRADLEVALDLWLQLDIVLDGGAIALDNVASFRYRRHAASVSSWTASEGSRFIEERDVMNATAKAAEQAGWPRAARTARRRWSSRVHAATRVVASLRTKDRSGLLTLLAHVFR